MPGGERASMSSEPGQPVVFEMPIEVTEAHIGAPGHHVNNIVYLQWVQDISIAHWQSAAPEGLRDQVAWYVVRHEIDYLKETFPGESLVARTHVGWARGARFERVVEILRQDGTPVVKARSTWAAIDVRTGRPTRVTEEMRAAFFTG